MIVLRDMQLTIKITIIQKIMQHRRQVIYLPFLMFETELYSWTYSSNDDSRKRADFMLLSVSFR